MGNSMRKIPRYLLTEVTNKYIPIGTDNVFHHGWYTHQSHRCFSQFRTFYPTFDTNVLERLTLTVYMDLILV